MIWIIMGFRENAKALCLQRRHSRPVLIEMEISYENRIFRDLMDMFGYELIHHTIALWSAIKIFCNWLASRFPLKGSELFARNSAHKTRSKWPIHWRKPFLTESIQSLDEEFWFHCNLTVKKTCTQMRISFSSVNPQTIIPWSWDRLPCSAAGCCRCLSIGFWH